MRKVYQHSESQRGVWIAMATSVVMTFSIFLVLPFTHVVARPERTLELRKASVADIPPPAEEEPPPPPEQEKPQEDTPPPPSLADTPQQVPVMADLEERPQPTAQTPPAYPAELRKAKVEGSVTVAFVVDENGRVEDARVEKSSHPEFEKSGLEAIRKWRFRPGRKEGQAVRTYLVQTFRFRPPGN